MVLLKIIASFTPSTSADAQVHIKQKKDSGQIVEKISHMCKQKF